jgi:hypothetical protein
MTDPGAAIEVINGATAVKFWNGAGLLGMMGVVVVFVIAVKLMIDELVGALMVRMVEDGVTEVLASSSQS